MRRTAALAFLFSFAALAPVRAQDAAVIPQGAVKSDPGTKKVLGLADVGRWNRIAGATLSPDGKWLTYAYTPNDGDATLFVKLLDGDKLYTVNVGSGAQFSDDSRFVGYFVSPPERAGRGGRGGGQPPAPGRGGQAGGAPTAPGSRFELLDLTSGEKFSVPDGATFKFSKGSHWLVVKTRKVNTAAKHNGTDLVLRELTTGGTQNIGNVNLYDFNDAGTHLAYSVDAADRVGNGVYAIELATGTSKALNTAVADYDQLAWSDKGSSLLVLRGDKPKDKKQRANSLLAWIDLGTPKAHAIEYDPSKDGTFPKNMVLSEFTSPRFTRDGSRIVFGIKEQEDSLPPGSEPQANVDVWHWKDAEVQSVQMIRLGQERRSTYTAEFILATGRFVRIGDSTLTNVQLTANPKYAVGRVDTSYRGEVAWGGSRADYYRVNTETGERTPIDRSLTRTMGSSTDGKWFLYLKNKQVYAFNLETAKSTPLAPGINFLDAEDDHPYEIPIYGIAGWSKDGRSVLLNHRFDVWNVPLDGGKASSLTGGVGDAQQIVFRIVRLDRAGGGRGGRGGGRGGAFAGGDDEDAGIDLTKPILLSAYGELTKKSGYYTLPPNGKPTPLIYDDAQIGAPQKAEKSDRVIFTRQTYTEFPNYWLSNTSFAAPKKVTDANPFIGEYAWGPKRVLIDYTNSKGQKLQGTLTLPANYEPGKKYPMIVYFYEIMSNTHHTFSMPTYDDRPHASEYASDGYLFFSPDVVYEIGKPGSSAVDCVTSAVKKVIELGYADPKRIGVQGHSWGGYQTSYMVTQTDMFAAIVTGAPPTNLISFYDETYPGTGTLQQGITEVGQVRMGTNPWDSHDLYEDQSPIYHVKKIKTPFLILHGTADNAVDWHQGLEFYGAARRWGKNVILLSYPGEPHHLARKENQKDFQTRMKQYFDHYLKGKPAPKWMTDGVPQVRKGGPIQ
jgi:dipeptidyl aminopeptidase/acylaminoacyl peptidase